MSYSKELHDRIEAMRRLPSPTIRRRIRERANVTRPELAEMVGVTAAAVHLWETGKADPGKRNVRHYVDALDELARMADPAPDTDNRER